MIQKFETIRLELGYSQKDFADKVLHMSLSAYKRLVLSKTNKFNDVISLIADVYKHTGQLLFVEFINKYDSDPRLRLIYKIEKMSKYQLKQVERFVNIFSQSNTDFSEIDKMQAIASLGKIYHKIIKMDLTEDQYYPITVNKIEWNSVQNKTYKCSTWLKNFVDDGYVHPDDAEEFKIFANLSNLKRLSKREHHYMRYRYRRKCDKGWRWVCMEIVRAPEYTDKHQVVFAYIRDIDDDYMG